MHSSSPPLSGSDDRRLTAGVVAGTNCELKLLLTLVTGAVDKCEPRWICDRGGAVVNSSSPASGSDDRRLTADVVAGTNREFKLLLTLVTGLVDECEGR